MPITVAQLCEVAGMDVESIKRANWGDRIECHQKGIYIVAITDTLTKMKVYTEAPIDINKVIEWRNKVGVIQVDGACSEPLKVKDRISEYWIPDETIVYIGKSERALQIRINEFYNHTLGYRRPHKGGEWLKTIKEINKLSVFYAAVYSPDEMERNLLKIFGENMSNNLSSDRLNEVKIPFANKEKLNMLTHTLYRKNHGIKYTPLR